jgi:hypothetical protein
MTPLVPAPDPLGLPVPVWILFGLKIFGFFVHLLFMNLWLAGLPVALCLLKSKPAVAHRLLRAMPFFIAFGINAGIVPLLFLQTIYPQFFYPATILQAWFWFLVIPLLLIAYYAVYLASFGRFRFTATLFATLLFLAIGVMFSSAMTLTAHPQAWPKIFIGSAFGGAVYGVHLHLGAEVLLRFALVVGMAFGTLAAYLVLDAEWFSKDRGYRTEVRRLLPIYALGAGIYIIAAAAYAAPLAQTIPRLWLLLAFMSLGLAVAGAFTYWRHPGPIAGTVLIAGQLLVLLANAIARQSVQVAELKRWFDPHKAPVRGEWGSFALFLITFVAALAILFWIGKIALRRTRSGSA